MRMKTTGKKSDERNIDDNLSLFNYDSDEYDFEGFV